MEPKTRRESNKTPKEKRAGPFNSKHVRIIQQIQEKRSNTK